MNKQHTALMPYLFTTLLTTLCATPYANAAQVKPTQIASEAYNAKVELMTALGKKVLGSFLDLNYHLSQEITIALPMVGKEITINWGFGGAGDIFSPFPATPVLIQRTADSANPITLEDLAIELGKDLVLEKALEHAQGIELLKWIIEGKLKPINLFFIKLLLLVKEGTHETEPHYLQAEFSRLMMRLSLTENTGIFDFSQPISSYLPKFMFAQINTLAPGLLATIDTWKNQLGVATPLSGTNTTATRSLSIFALSDKKAADALYGAIQQATPENRDAAIDAYIEQSFIKTVDYEDFQSLIKTDFMVIPGGDAQATKSLGLTKNMAGTATFTSDASGNWNTTEGLPVAVKDALNAISKPSTLVLVTINPHEYWICSVAPYEDMAQNIVLIGNTFVQAFREYNIARKKYFKANPQEAIDYQNAWNERERQKGLVKAFLKTEVGRNSTKRLSATMASIKASSTTLSQETLEHNARDEQIAALEQERTNAQQMIKRLEQIAMGGNIKAVTRLQNDIDEITNKIAQLKAERLEQAPAATAQAPEPSATTIAEQRKTLQELQILVKRLKVQGMPIPQELAEQISTLQKNVGLHARPTTIVIPLGSRLAMRHALANTYHNEALTIQTDLNEKLAQYTSIPGYQELSSYWEFVSMLQPKYEAYYKNLVMQAHRIREENANMKTLTAYRERSAKDMDNEMLAQFRQLEMTTGDLLSGPIDGNAAGSLLRNNPEIQEFAISMVADNQRYSNVRNNLLNALRGIVKKFQSHDNRHQLIYRYLIQQYVPILVPLYDQVAEEPNPAFFGGE